MEVPYDSTNSVVICQNVHKAFKKGNRPEWVLDGLSVEIAMSKIFSLLGASGCGKTTLLKCVIGKMQVDQGCISVFGQQPKPGRQIGYMPQFTSLSESLTVNEVMWLYGRLTEMSKKDAKIRTEFLLGLLEMTECKNTKIGHLSGGEQRRVSFAVALLHAAPLLILDEPTVGLDPILRHKIWIHLKHLADNCGTTIIITTHYIEEARHSDCVSFLANGRLLVCSPPSYLMQKYNFVTLEQVFLHLYRLSTENLDVDLTDHQRTCSVDNFDMTRIAYHNTHSCSHRFKTIKQKLSPKQTLQCKNIVTIFKMWHLEAINSPCVIAIQIFLALFMILLVPLTMDTAKIRYKLRIGVVNKDSGELGQSFINHLESQVFQVIPYDVYETAVKESQFGKLFGVINIKQNFTQAFIQRMENPMAVDNETITASIIHATFEECITAITGVLKSEMLMMFKKFVLHHNFSNAEAPLKFTHEMSKMPNFRSFSYPTPAVILSNCVMMFSSVSAVFLSLACQPGQIDRLYMAGMSSFELFMSLLVYQGLLGIPYVAVNMFGTFIINELPCYGSYWLVTLFIYTQVICGICIGILVAAISSNNLTVILLLDIVLIVTLLMQGVTSPLEAMSKSIQSLFILGPVARPVIALRSILTYAWTISHHAVSISFVTMLSYIGICLFTSLVVFRLKE